MKEIFLMKEFICSDMFLVGVRYAICEENSFDSVRFGCLVLLYCCSKYGDSKKNLKYFLRM